MVLEDGPLGRILGHEGGVLINGIDSLIKEVQESSLVPFCYVRIQEVGSLQPRNRLSPELDHVDTLILDIQPPEL